MVIVYQLWIALKLMWAPILRLTFVGLQPIAQDGQTLVKSYQPPWSSMIIFLVMIYLRDVCFSLKPSTRYYYVVGSEQSSFSRQFSFKTPPNPSPDTETNIIAFGGK